MKLPTIVQLAKSPVPVEFVRYQDQTLWYRATYFLDDDPDVFEFPVPCDDTGTGVFLAQDKPIFFMRWMRKHLAFLQKSFDTQAGRCEPPAAPPAPRIGPKTVKIL